MRPCSRVISDLPTVPHRPERCRMPDRICCLIEGGSSAQAAILHSRRRDRLPDAGAAAPTLRDPNGRSAAAGIPPQRRKASGRPRTAGMPRSETFSQDHAFAVLQGAAGPAGPVAVAPATAVCTRVSPGGL